MKKKGHFLATAGAAQTQPSSSCFFFPRTNHYVCMALGKNKSGRSKQFWHIQHSNSRAHAKVGEQTRTRDLTHRRNIHYNCTTGRFVLLTVLNLLKQSPHCLNKTPRELR